MGEGRPNGNHDHPRGGVKDTDDLSGVKGAQDQSMAEKARQADQTPRDVTGDLDGAQSINQRR